MNSPTQEQVYLRILSTTFEDLALLRIKYRQLEQEFGNYKENVPSQRRNATKKQKTTKTTPKETFNDSLLSDLLSGPNYEVSVREPTTLYYAGETSPSENS